MASLADILLRLHPEMAVPFTVFLQQKQYEGWLIERGKRYGMIGKRKGIR